MTELIVGAHESDTHQKALRINLDPRWYGTVAEIGAGQEVVRWFFRVGGAAGTVAKSISAYDMAVSDAVYGKVDRYVSAGRLQGMLDHEFQLNVDRLDDERGDENCFFAFADTVVARSFRGGNECHGWMGVKFQAQPHDEPSQIVMHVRMLDVEAFAQQEALGIVGVNLLYGAFFQHHEPDKLIESLLDRLTTGRIEIDMIQFRGIEFRKVDNRLMALKLVQVGLSGVAMFGPDREVLQPSEVLRKKAVLVERGSFRPPTHVNVDMLETAKARFAEDLAVAGKPVLALTEITMRNLLAGGATDVDRRDFLARAELLAACGMTVLISNYFDYFRLAAYIAERTSERIGIVMGVPSLIDLFDERNHVQLPGGILESFGRLFKNDLKLYVYPLQPSGGGRAEDGERHPGRARAPAALRLPGRAGELRPPRQLPARVPDHLQPRRAAADRRGRRLLGGHGPARGGRAHQAPRVLRLRQGRPVLTAARARSAALALHARRTDESGRRAAVCLSMTVLMEGIVFGESPRWHDGRVWFSDWGAHQVIALDPDGRSEVIVSVPSFPMCIDFLPDGRLLVVDSARRRLLRREPDGSMVTHADLAPFSLKPWNEVVVDADGNAYVNNIGYDFPGGEPAPGSVVLVTAAGAVRRGGRGSRVPERDGDHRRRRHAGRRGVARQPADRVRHRARRRPGRPAGVGRHRRRPPGRDLRR